MNALDYCSKVITIFALFCEQMNAYAQKLRQLDKYKLVKTGADIRQYKDGWRLEKWIEILLNEEKGTWAALWLEMGVIDNAWTITHHLSISHNEFFFEFPQKTTTSIEELEHSLSEAHSELISALETNKSFVDEVIKHTCQHNSNNP